MSLLSRTDRVLRAHLRERFLVTLGSGQTWEGVLVDSDDQTLVLRDASVVSADGSKVAADGEVLLPRFDVSYLQRP